MDWSQKVRATFFLFVLGVKCPILKQKIPHYIHNDCAFLSRRYQPDQPCPDWFECEPNHTWQLFSYKFRGLDFQPRITSSLECVCLNSGCVGWEFSDKTVLE